MQDDGDDSGTLMLHILPGSGSSAISEDDGAAAIKDRIEILNADNADEALEMAKTNPMITSVVVYEFPRM